MVTEEFKLFLDIVNHYVNYMRKKYFNLHYLSWNQAYHKCSETNKINWPIDAKFEWP